MDLFLELIKEINRYIILNEKRNTTYLDTLPDNLFKRNKGNELTKFQKDKNVLKKTQNNKYLSVHNLQILLNLGNKFLVNKILKNIENPTYEYECNRKVYEIRKIRTSTKKWFSRSPEDINYLLQLFENYFQGIDTTIIDKILWILDDFLDYTISTTSLAIRMNRYKDYLTTAKNWFTPHLSTYFEFSSFFNFINHLLFIEYYIPSLKKSRITQLKEKFLKLMFKHIVDLGLYDSETEEIFFIQFKAISYITFASTVIKTRKNLKPISSATIKNNMVNLVEFSQFMKWGENYFPGLFKKRSLMSKTTIFSIQSEIEKNKKFCKSEYKKITHILNELISTSRSYIYRTAYIGILSQSILEEISLRKLIKEGLDIEFESHINLPFSLHRVDLLIKRPTKYFSMDTVIDFTLTTEYKYILDKLNRNYQKLNRELLIVVYSKNRREQLEALAEKIKGLTFNHKENVKIISIDTFCEIINTSINLNPILILFYKAIHNNNDLKELERRNIKSLKSLEKFISK